MTLKLAKEKWPGRVLEMVIGQDPWAVIAGGDNTLPFHHFEGEMANRPVAALEIWDVEPTDWPEAIKAQFEGVLDNPVAWAKKCEDYGADMVCLKTASANPEGRNASPLEVAATVRAVAEAVRVPLIITGCGVEEKDVQTLQAVGEAISGYNALLGCATANNYQAITEACMLHGHNLIATSPLDINLAKQLNILISELDLPLNRIAMDPLVGALGYGLEYAYSIIERSRLGALGGDKMLSAPIICFVGQETWKTREARTEQKEEWGAQTRRAILWETVTAASLALAGGSIFVLRHPETLKQFNEHILALMKPNSY